MQDVDCTYKTRDDAIVALTAAGFQIIASFSVRS